MGESQGPASEAVETEGDRTPEQVREEIEQTRVELGDTVAELAAKTDVKAQAHRAADNAKAQALHAADNAKVQALHAADSAKTQALQAADNAKAISQEHSQRLALVAIAVAVLGTGLLIRRRRS